MDLLDNATLLLFALVGIFLRPPAEYVSRMGERVQLAGLFSSVVQVEIQQRIEGQLRLLVLGSSCLPWDLFSLSI